MKFKNQGISKIFLVVGIAIGLMIIVIGILLIINLNSCDEKGTITSLTENPNCCEGLIARPTTDSYIINDDNSCKQGDDSKQICIACGDNICETDLENYCNCPEDCPTPEEETQSLVVEEYPIVEETEDTPNRIEFKERISSDILAIREDWRTPQVYSSNTSSSDPVDPYIDKINEEMEDTNFKFSRNILPENPIDGRAFYDLYYYKNKVVENLSFIRKFHLYEEKGTISFSAEQVLSEDKTRNITYYNGEILEWNQNSQADPIIIDGKLLEVVKEESEDKKEYHVKNDSEPLYTFSPDEEPVVNRLVESFFAWENHWVLEYRNTNDETLVISDGISIAENEKYKNIFNYVLIKNKAFYFFEKDDRFQINYNGETLSNTYDSIIHNNCCEASIFNPTSNDNMIYFYALKRGTWYYVEAGVYDS